MIDLDDLIKRVNAEIKKLSHDLDFWEDIKTCIEDQRNDDEIDNHLKYG